MDEIDVNSFFDHIYCLNLERRPDRWEEAQNEFEKHGIRNVERFQAVDGTQIDCSGYPARMKPGDVGSLLSHIAMFNDAMEKGYESFLLLEDDVQFVDSFRQEFAAGAPEIPENWDMLYLGGNHAMGYPVRLTDRISITIATLATHAVAFRNTSYQRLLDLLNVNEPNDMTYAMNQTQFNSFVFLPPLAWQRAGWSDVAQGHYDYDFLRNGR